MKRSKTIVLASIATALVACDNSQPPPENFDAYNSKQECIADWQEEQACEKKYDHHSRSLIWVGPRYFRNSQPFYTRQNGTRIYRNSSSGVVSRPVVISPITIPSVNSKGGFGSIGRSFSVSTSGG